MMSQTYAIEQDEGWYRCVAKNGEGVIYEDTYLTIGGKFRGNILISYFFSYKVRLPILGTVSDIMQ